MSTLKVGTIQNTSGVEVYTCKAWVNFNGTGTVAIRASGNVSSITDNGTGDYTVNFTNAMPDANYNAVFGAAGNGTNNVYSLLAIHASTSQSGSATLKSTSQIRVANAGTNANVFTDNIEMQVSVFR